MEEIKKLLTIENGFSEVKELNENEISVRFSEHDFIISVVNKKLQIEVMSIWNKTKNQNQH